VVGAAESVAVEEVVEGVAHMGEHVLKEGAMKAGEWLLEQATDPDNYQIAVEFFVGILGG
jgi:hypothetical protein